MRVKLNQGRAKKRVESKSRARQKEGRVWIKSETKRGWHWQNHLKRAIKILNFRWWILKMKTFHTRLSHCIQVCRIVWNTNSPSLPKQTAWFGSDLWVTGDSRYTIDNKFAFPMKFSSTFIIWTQKDGLFFHVLISSVP